MPPNNKLEDIVQVALPYVQPAYKLQPQSEDPPVYHQASSSSQELADEEEEEPALRVTTRARLTYELDRFPKNEMLIINNKNTDVGKMLYRMHSFQRFKFEFTVIDTEVDGDEVWQKINHFFQKDFSEIGLVGVMTAISNPDPEDLTPSAHQVQELDVLNYFMSNQFPTLQEKPKIFISEAPKLSNLPQMTSFPTDTLIVQAQKITRENKTSSPLDLLCCKLMKMEDTRNVLDVLTDVTDHWREAFFPTCEPPTTPPVKYLTTLTKELLLEKEANTNEKWIEKMLSTILDPNMPDLYERVYNTYATNCNEAVQSEASTSSASTSSGSNGGDAELNWLQNVLDTVSRDFLDSYNDAYYFHGFEGPAGPRWKQRVLRQPRPVHPPEVYERITNLTNW